MVYGSQDDLKQQLGRAGIGVFDYRHAGLADVTTTIRAVGRRTGDEAKGTSSPIASSAGSPASASGSRDAAGRARCWCSAASGWRCAALYASGGIGFLNDMLDVAGGTNVFADVKLQAVQASTEQILAKRPEVILEARAANSAFPSGDRQSELNVWKAVSAVPAVRNNRVLFLFDDRIVIPGPRVVEGTELLARALHPDAFR